MHPDAEVLVVGAGPTGLTTALQLARHGVRTRIIDKSACPSRTSRALGLQARTLELLEYAGLADRFVAAGHKVGGIHVFSAGKQIVDLSLEDIESRYNYVLILPQSETERLLGDGFREAGGSIEWGTELVDMTPGDKDVVATFRRADGSQESAGYMFVVGCDGPHSAVRDKLAIPFHGSQFPETFALADVKLQSLLPRNRVSVFLCGATMTAFFPQSNDVWRVVIESHDETPPTADPTRDEMQRSMDACGPLNPQITSILWSSRFRISQRQVEHYRRGRVFLAGDAAHIHSPMGGQGMNTGMQDACNLAWKIALAVNSVAAPALLDSYETERLPIGADVLRSTGALSRLVLSQIGMVDAVRNHVAPMLVGWEPIQERILNALSEIAVAYKSSPIVANSGRRAPDAWVRRDGAELRLYEALRDPRHKLIYCGARQPGAAISAVIQEHAAFVELLHATEDLQNVYRTSGEIAIAIRPDGYIGYRGAPEAAAVRGYFCRLFRMRSPVDSAAPATPP